MLILSLTQLAPKIKYIFTYIAYLTKTLDDCILEGGLDKTKVFLKTISFLGGEVEVCVLLKKTQLQ